MPLAARPTPPERIRDPGMQRLMTGGLRLIRQEEGLRDTAAQCLMCRSTAALPHAELCTPCQREFEGLSEKPSLAVLRFDMAQRAALQAQQRVEQERLSELKALFSRSRFLPDSSEQDDALPVSTGALRATARREIAQPTSVPVAKVKTLKAHRSPRGTVKHRLEGLANSEAKHEAARAAMERRRRIRRGEIVSSEEEDDEEEQDTVEQPQFRRAVDLSKCARRGGPESPETLCKPKHVITQQIQQIRRNIAFCMGIHRRVGRGSAMFRLPGFLVKSILSVVDDALLDLAVLSEHSLLSPLGPSKATRGAVTAMVADTNTWRLFAGGEDGSIVVWNYATCRQEQVLRGHSRAIQTLAIITNRQTAQPVSGRQNDTAVRGSSPRGEEQRTEALSHQMCLLQLRFPQQSLDSLRRLLRYHRGDTEAATAYLEAHVAGGGVQETLCVAAASSSPAGASSIHGRSRSAPAAQSHPTSQHKAERSGAGAIPSSKCSFLLVSGCAEGAVVWTGKSPGCLSMRQRLHHIGGGTGPADSIAALAGGGGSLPLLVCGGKRREVHLWDLHAEPTGSVGLRHSMVGHCAPITALAMPHHDQITDRGTQMYLHSKSSAAATTLSSDFAAECLWCVSGCKDGTIQRWDLVRGVATHVLKAHDSPVTSLALASVRRSPSRSCSHEATAGKGVGFWRLFSGGDTKDGCIRCWDTFECFSGSTETQTASYRYDQGASGPSRLLGHKLEMGAGVNSMYWVAPSLVRETCGTAGPGGDDGGVFGTDYAGWLCCTLTNRTVIALRAADCASRGSLVGIFRSAVTSARSRERVQLPNVATAVVVPVPLRGTCNTQAAAAAARAKKAVAVICAVGDTMRIFTTTE